MLTENQLFANRYLLVKRLGQGAFSEVWKAEDTKTGNLTVALKIYAPDKGLDEDGAKVFSEEFAIVFNVHHSNLLTPTYYDEEHSSPYLVLPFCEQGSTTRLIGKMDELEVAKFVHDVSSALAYLHENEIVHQDIKPDNVLIDKSGNYLLTDFGISTRMRSTLRRSVTEKKGAGTRAYMGPERFSRNNHSVKASDIWSLGATLHELMSRDVPFGEDGGLVQMMGAVIPEVEGNWSSNLKRMVERCLAKDTWDRPTATQLYNISNEFLRNGHWDLSLLENKAAGKQTETSHIERPVSRPTERKINAEIFSEKEQERQAVNPNPTASGTIPQSPSDPSLSKPDSQQFISEQLKKAQNKVSTLRRVYISLLVVLSIILIAVATTKQARIKMLTSENTELYDKNDRLRSKNTSLRETNEHLQEENGQLSKVVKKVSENTPVIVSSVEVKNEGEEYGGTIYSKRTTYLYPRVKGFSLIEGTTTLQFKLYGPGGLRSGKTSPKGYSFQDDVYLSENRNFTYDDMGWGGTDKGHYAAGQYRYEVWYKGKCIGSKSFTIH